MIEGLEKLRQRRLKWIEANRENNFEDGIKRLLTDLYPDNAHFIYELLQNAEDPRASSVRFTLTNDTVEFEHNGERLFSLSDVESITSIGTSTKRNDPTSIGKFGVGFKAVFAYTNTPEIHSGEFHFRIRDLVLPSSDGVEIIQMGDRETRFKLPFDHPTKQKRQACAEVERALRALGDNTLLFLANIRKIEYLLPDGSIGSLEREDLDDGRIQIRARKPEGEDTISNWLHFQKEVTVTDEDNLTKTCRVAIAYSLSKEENVREGHSTWKIVPLDRGQVSIYFPADKENSNLRFHIHAPFASTVARDSVRACEANRTLRDHIADLVVESLTIIREKRMLTMSFLGVLPNQLDGLTEFYEPIRLALVRTFRDESLTPTKSRRHAPANALYRGPSRISEVLNDDDLALLTGGHPPLWAANPSQQNQREDRFLDSLGIDNWDWTELCETLTTSAITQNKSVENWISQKSDAWLMRFYALLGEAIDTHNEYIEADHLRIVRIGDDQGHEHVLPREAFFLPELDTLPPQGIRFVKPEVWSTGRSDTQKRFATSFLKHIGVRSYDERTIIQLKLMQYANSPDKVGDAYYKDLKQFVDYWKRNPTDTPLFRGCSFLLGLDKKSRLQWLMPTQLCIDSPYLDTGLADLQHFHNKSVVWNGYFDVAMLSPVEDFVKFLQAIGVRVVLPVVETSCLENPEYEFLRSAPGERRSSPINTDYTIRGLDQFLAKPSLRISRLVWQTMCSIPRHPNQLIATYRRSARGGAHQGASQLVHVLRQCAWVPQGNDAFARPTESSRALLPEGFPFDPGWAWLKAISFGIEADKRTTEYQQRQTVARELGFESKEEADEWVKVKMAGISPTEILHQFAQRSRASQPGEPVSNPERRRRGVLERRDNAPAKESVTRERAIQPHTKHEICVAKAYLRAKYTNTEGQLICQCCHAEMPFKVKDDHYFEAVQCLRNLSHHYFENRLALCPTCAAMYRHARETDDVEIRRSVIEHESPDRAPSVEITINLAGCQHQLRFVGTHWFDLKTVLNGP